MKYLVRIIPVMFEWHGEHSVFTSPTTLKIKFMDTFKDKLPSTPDLILGYVVKRGGKRGIEHDLDFTSMYSLMLVTP